MSALTGAVLLSLSAMVIIGVLGYTGLVLKSDCVRYGLAITAISGLGGYTLRHVVGMISPGKDG